MSASRSSGPRKGRGGSGRGGPDKGSRGGSSGKGRRGGPRQGDSARDGRRGRGRPGESGEGRSGGERHSGRRSTGSAPRGTGQRASGPKKRGPKPSGGSSAGRRWPGASSSQGSNRSRGRVAPRSRVRDSDDDFFDEPREDHPSHDASGERLQKILAGAGVASRRASEELVAEGRVTVDGVVVTAQGLRINPETAVVHVDGSRIQLDTSKVYLALNKPMGVVSTMSDPEGRPCLGDLLQGRTDRLFHVGRLDADTEGLLILTNDGDLSHRLQHPSYEIDKVYVAEVAGAPARSVGKTLREGVVLDDGPVKVTSFTVLDSRPGKALVQVVLHEGRNHIVRRLLEHVGNPVVHLARTQIGPVRLGDVKPGKMRPLNRQEVGALLAAAGM